MISYLKPQRTFSLGQFNSIRFYPWLYVFLIIGAELTTSHFIYWGLMVHLALLIAILIHAVYTTDKRLSDLLTAISIAPLILGKAEDSSRKWIMALGHGSAKLDEKGVCGVHDFASRVIRDKQYKVWVNGKREIEQLYDLKVDPFEKSNLTASTSPDHVITLKKFRAVVESMPEKDARPKYDQREALPWDRKS